MALYIPAGARRRRLVLGVLGGLIVGLLLGYLAGRATSPGLEDEVGDVQALAADAATAFQRLPIEYEQMLAGAGGETKDTVQSAIDGAQQQLRATASEAIWLSQAALADVDAGIDELSAVVRGAGTARDFAAAVEVVVAEIEDAFAITAEPAG